MHAYVIEVLMEVVYFDMDGVHVVQSVSVLTEGFGLLEVFGGASGVMVLLFLVLVILVVLLLEVILLEVILLEVVFGGIGGASHSS